jgi:hypothetical protein
MYTFVHQFSIICHWGSTYGMFQNNEVFMDTDGFYAIKLVIISQELDRRRKETENIVQSA